MHSQNLRNTSVCNWLLELMEVELLEAKYISVEVIPDCNIVSV